MVQVPQEETLREIQDRYLELNAHSESFNWKVLFKL